ncbi:hypothetical protein LJB88_04965 [Erysipelotrichaceae bacterium OttesenSCG-928-M19]|nr:hypothetical protein [Erysipelotrichaceae bacterium OttesenSCG-928-M19]
MKRIHLSEQSSQLLKKDLKKEIQELILEIEKTCFKTGLSYSEINEALYHVDVELYNLALHTKMKTK